MHLYYSKVIFYLHLLIPISMSIFFKYFNIIYIILIIIIYAPLIQFLLFTYIFWYRSSWASFTNIFIIMYGINNNICIVNTLSIIYVHLLIPISMSIFFQPFFQISSRRLCSNAREFIDIIYYPKLACFARKTHTF